MYLVSSEIMTWVAYENSHTSKNSTAKNQATTDHPEVNTVKSNKNFNIAT